MGAESVTPQIDNPNFQNQSFATVGLSQWYDTLSIGNSISGLTREFRIAERQLLQSQDILSIVIVDSSQWHCGASLALMTATDGGPG